MQNRGPEAEKEKETKIILKSEPKEQKQAVVNLVDVPSDDDSFLEHSLFDDSLMYFDDFHHFPGNTCTLQCGNTPTTSGSPGLNLFTSQSMSCTRVDDQCSKSVELVDPIHSTSGHKGRKIECPTCHGHFLTEEIGFHADLCAENAHRVAFFDITEDLPPDDIPEGCTGDVICNGAQKALPNDLPLSEILIPLMDKLEPQSRINVRRGQLFADYIETRKRCNWLKPESKLKVVFIAEPAEDTGGPRREFFTGLIGLFSIKM